MCPLYNWGVWWKGGPRSGRYTEICCRWRWSNLKLLVSLEEPQREWSKIVDLYRFLEVDKNTGVVGYLVHRESHVVLLKCIYYGRGCG